LLPGKAGNKYFRFYPLRGNARETVNLFRQSTSARQSRGVLNPRRE
jgi:hypothetical protein